MVHLSTVHGHGNHSKDFKPESAESAAGKKQPTQLQLSNYADDFTTSIYGSRFAGQELPKNRMPECEMPREIAYRLIKDDLSLDNNPKLK